MTKAINLPAAGEGAFLRFSLEAMEKLHEIHGEDYLFTTLRRLELGDPVTLRFCADNLLFDADEGVTLATLVEREPLSELALAFSDAIYLAWKGEKLSEIVVLEEVGEEVGER